MSNLVLASYFTGTKDPQRDIIWDSNPAPLMPLIDSVTAEGIDIVILHDCFDAVPSLPHCQWFRVDDDLTGVYSASVLRWFRYRSYLTALSTPPQQLFMVDSTDVIMLSNPFPHINPNTLYCGDEAKMAVGCKWLRKKARRFVAPDFNTVIEPFQHHRMLNAGLVGGDGPTCQQFLAYLTDYHRQYNTITDASDTLDMPAFNYTVWKHFSDRLVHGDPVNTEFTKNQVDRTRWWKHK